MEGEVTTTVEVGECSAGTLAVGPNRLGLGDGTFWVLIDVGDLLPHVGANGLCDDECANGLLLHIHNLEAAVVLPLPVNLVTVHLLGVGMGVSRSEQVRASEVGPNPSCLPLTLGTAGRARSKGWELPGRAKLGDFLS